MKRHLLASLALLPFFACSQTAQSPQDFITLLYSDDTVNLDQLFSPAMRSILDENIRLTPKNETPYLNFNPLCGCQESELKLQKIASVGPEKRGRYDTVLQVFYSQSDERERSLILKLIPDGMTWQIDDFVYPESGSLKIKLQEVSANRVKRAGRKTS
jgi:hypothetical protein